MIRFLKENLLLKYLAFPLSVISMMIAIYSAPKIGVPIEASIVIVSILNFFLVYFWERFIPYRQDWNRRDNENKNDYGHLIFGTALGGFIGKEFSQTLVGIIAIFFLTTFSISTLWPSELPFLLNILLVFLIADLGRYIQHYAHHRFNFLWNFHVLHHATDTLWAIKSSRSNIFERILQQVALYGPLSFLGAPVEAVTFFVAFNSLLGPYSHSNGDFRLGFLNYIIMGPEVHRIHHGKFQDLQNSNYGSATVIWDIVFKTYSPTHSKPRYFDVGEESGFNESGFLKQALFPIIKSK